jgi:hypothetical protein
MPHDPRGKARAAKRGARRSVSPNKELQNREGATGPGRGLYICRKRGLILPKMSGRVLADELLRHRPEARVVYMSGYTGDLLARQGAIGPGALLLEKPFTAEALLQKVRQAREVS